MITFSAHLVFDAGACAVLCFLANEPCLSWPPTFVLKRYSPALYVHHTIGDMLIIMIHMLQGVEAAVAVMRPLCVRARGVDYMLEVSITRSALTKNLFCALVT